MEGREANNGRADNFGWNWIIVAGRRRIGSGQLEGETLSDSQATLSSPRHSPGSSTFDSSFMTRMSNFDSYFSCLRKFVFTFLFALAVFIHDF